MYDNTHYHAVAIQKYKRDAYDPVRKVITGKVCLDMPLSIQVIENLVEALIHLVTNYKLIAAEHHRKMAAQKNAAADALIDPST
jgi:hypothetical protein